MENQMLTSQKKLAPFGKWTSLIVPSTTSRIDKSARNIDILVKDGKIYWTEPRPNEKGRTVLVCRELKDNATTCDLTPLGFDVRSKVHEYGGAPFTVYQGIVYFINNRDQVLYKQIENEAPIALTSGEIRLANMQGCLQGLIAVAEKHSEDRVDNFLVLVCPRTGKVKILDQGHDFYSSPFISRDEKFLAWLTWDHPNMPWDGTQLWTAELIDGHLQNKKCVAGGPDEAIFQPQWSPTNTLYFISDRTGWWNFYRLNGNEIENIYPIHAEFALPLWRFGMSTWGFTGYEDQILCTYKEEGVGKLAFLNPADKTIHPIHLPFTDYSQISVGGACAVMLMGSPTFARRVMSLDLKNHRASPIDTIEPLDIGNDWFSIPQSIKFPTTLGQIAYGYYYPPLNPDYQGPQGKQPPLILLSHGGPTGCADSSFNLKIQYWTSRGFAVLDVNYRGSVGFGRDYRNSLRGKWGIVDVQDCEQGALYLANKGLVDRKHLFIRGASAGGYTTLAALAFTKTFAAGASYYGVGDLLTLVQDTHKFESRYLDTLIGPLPDSKTLYFERSPLFHAEKIKCPVIFFQGENDKIVPKNQAELMYDALKQKGVHTELIIYENEEHGFRQAAHIEDAFNRELVFYLDRLSE
jgi:dipeptidyl aminopeptidase/acylaminoacyl peptidase